MRTPNRQKRLRHCYRGSRYACARVAPKQASVRARETRPRQPFLRAKRAPWTAHGPWDGSEASKRQGIKQNGIKIPENFSEGALCARRRFAPGSGSGGSR
jgi:hypothetical protein